MAGRPKTRARRAGLILASEAGQPVGPLQATPVHAHAGTLARAESLVDDPDEAKRQTMVRLLMAILGDWEPSPSQVMAGKVVLEAIDQLRKDKPRNAREMLDAVRRALPELERRAALEGGETQQPQVMEPKGDW